ncbi:hypothetical protein RND81_07G025800 [Saponaria officinalis]|uniref:Transmembrane protein 131-like N-terminal domain-containing protein n=1 Tax=Saponaria officinalis TaxID=3572 RepID=A0AAW1JL74_SAPOF
MLYDSHAKKQCSRRRNPNINRSQSGAELLKQTSKQDSNVSWRSSDDWTISCFMNIECRGHGTFLTCVNNTDQIVLFPGQGYLLKREAGFISQKIEIETSSLELSSPCLSISPKNLDWGENYIYHPFVAFVKLKNICEKNAIKVYEPFSPNLQFYPFNYSEVVLGRGEVTSISFVFLPKWLGAFSAELVLQTSLGGFLVQAKGSVIESPHRLLPLVVVDVSSGERLSRKLSLTDLLDETIYLEKVTALNSVIRNCDTLFDEAICRRLDPQGFQEYNFSDGNNGSNGEQLHPVGPHRTEIFLE